VFWSQCNVSPGDEVSVGKVMIAQTSSSWQEGIKGANGIRDCVYGYGGRKVCGKESYLEWLAGHQRAGGSLRCVVVPSELGPGQSGCHLHVDAVEYFTLLRLVKHFDFDGSYGIQTPSAAISAIGTISKYFSALRVCCRSVIHSSQMVS
jgi:hypothetical protein